MIDDTGKAGLDTVVQTEKQINASGNNEQWQRQLEKAYFERQRAAMQSRGRDHAETSSQRDESPAEVRHGLGEAGIVTAAGDAGSAHPPVRPAAATPSPARPSVGLAGATRTVHPNAPAASAAPGHSRAVLNARGADPAAGTRSVTPAWRGALPATSSASVLLSGHGAHLVIRDTSLPTQVVRQALDRLRGLFAAEGQRLWAVTLNGERLWQASDGAPLSNGDSENDSGIDIQY